MVFVLALAAAAVWGTADFLGGKTSRNHSVLTVITASQISGLVTLFGAALLIGGSPNIRDTILVSAGSLAGLGGLALLYWGLAQGKMSVVAPVTALTGPMLPLIWGLADGDKLSRVAGVGVVLGLLAIVLISRSPDGRSHRLSINKSIGIALGAGVCFGIFLIALGNVGEDSGLWPLAYARVTSVALLIAIALVKHTPLVVSRDRAAVATVGVFDAVANALVLLAFRAGSFTIAAVLSNMYPASTVVLARVVDRERFAQVQIVGLLTGVVAIAFIVAG